MNQAKAIAPESGVKLAAKERTERKEVLKTAISSLKSKMPDQASIVPSAQEPGGISVLTDGSTPLSFTSAIEQILSEQGARPISTKRGQCAQPEPDKSPSGEDTFAALQSLGIVAVMAPRLISTPPVVKVLEEAAALEVGPAEKLGGPICGTPGEFETKQAGQKRTVVLEGRVIQGKEALITEKVSAPPGPEQARFESADTARSSDPQVKLPAYPRPLSSPAPVATPSPQWGIAATEAARPRDGQTANHGRGWQATESGVVPTPSKELGTGDAQRGLPMQTRAEMKQIAVPTEQKMPSVPPVFSATAREPERSRSAGREFIAIEPLAVPGLDPGLSTVLNNWYADEAQVPAENTLRPALLAEVIADHVSVLHQRKAATLEVVVRLSPNTALRLNLQQQGETVTVRARWEQGGGESLLAGWDHIQQTLNHQGIRLLPLQELPAPLTPATSASSNGSSQSPPDETGRQASSRQPAHHTQDREGRSAKPVQSSAPRPLRSAGTRGRHWERWA